MAFGVAPEPRPKGRTANDSQSIRTGLEADAIDTALDSPDDICPWETAPVVRRATYVAQPRSVVLLALALEGSPGSVPEVE